MYVILSRPKGGEESLPRIAGPLRRFAAHAVPAALRRRRARQRDKLLVIPPNPIEPKKYHSVAELVWPDRRLKDKQLFCPMFDLASLCQALAWD